MAWEACLPIAVAAVLLLTFTKGHLSYKLDRNAQLIEVPRHAEMPQTTVYQETILERG